MTEERKTKFVELLDFVLDKNNKGEFARNIDYSLKAKLAGLFDLKASIFEECESLVRLYGTNFDFEFTKIGKITKIKPKNDDARENEIELMKKISIKLEFFSYLFISFFDVLAIYTKFMYPKNSVGTRSFSDLQKWFKKHPDVDAEFSKHINNMLWRDNFKKRRDVTVHKLSPIVIPDHKHGIFRIFACIELDDTKQDDVKTLIDSYMKELARFLEFYGNHHLNRLNN